MKQTYFFTEVKSLPAAHGLAGQPWQATSDRAGTDTAATIADGDQTRRFRPQISEQLRQGLQRVGAEVLQTWQVIGHDYDLILVGSVPDPNVLSKIDSICKATGYEAKTHLAFEASEYAQDFEQVRKTVMEPAEAAGSRR